MLVIASSKGFRSHLLRRATRWDISVTFKVSANQSKRLTCIKGFPGAQVKRFATLTTRLLSRLSKTYSPVIGPHMNRPN